MVQANAQYLRTLRHLQHFAHVRRCWAKQYLSHFLKYPALQVGAGAAKHCFCAAASAHLRGTASAGTCACAGTRPLCVGGAGAAGPEIQRGGGTCARPQSLRKTLQTLRWQTYRNFEVIVAEDGEPVSRAMVEQEFADLPIHYLCTGTRQGRGKTATWGCGQPMGNTSIFWMTMTIFTGPFGTDGRQGKRASAGRPDFGLRNGDEGGHAGRNAMAV